MDKSPLSHPTGTPFTPDPCQQEVIEAEGGFHLVLAPPGCGKTQILTERIRHAHEHGHTEYADMLCLTFTNRAARGMNERIAACIGDKGVADVFVGNVHRFCSRFLFAEGLVPSETSIIDEDDAISILARFLGEDEYYVAANYNRRREYCEIFHLAAMMHQIRHAHPKNLRTHTECINASDIAAIRRICSVTGRTFDAKAMTDIYDHAEQYRDLTLSDTCDYGDRQIISRMLQKMTLAQQYRQYKRQNRLIDFQDLLLMTFDALAGDTERTKYHRYKWIQVDEVQDLNALQMAIISQLAARPLGTVMLLGDEQQAIFSFMGAKADMLAALKDKAGCHLHRLDVNHRSPRYLLDIFNTYAAKVLGIDPALLPDAGQPDPNALTGNELQTLCSEDYGQEVRDCVQFAGMLEQTFPDTTTAILVNANRDAEDLSGELRKRRLPHFKVSGTDLFASADMKLLLAHLGVLACETSFMAWARLMKGLRVYESNAAARHFVRQLFDRAIMPTDLMSTDGMTYLQRFAAHYEQDTIVVFDTETTGLNVFDDDILQIAAVKMRGGKVVEGSEFAVYIETERPIPAMLGDIVNPIIEERRHHKLIAHGEALRMFAQYAQGGILLGHNADYDYHILDNNLRRYAPDICLAQQHPTYIDSLRLVRLLHPELHEHKLKYLLAVLGLEGTNSHLADDDVNATRSVVEHCYRMATERIDEQRRFLADRRVQQRAETLRRNYADTYRRAVKEMWTRPNDGTDNTGNGGTTGGNAYTTGTALTDEMLRFYTMLLDGGMTQPIGDLQLVLAYIANELIDAQREPSLAEQLAAHAMEINTLKEADLCGSRNMAGRIIVSTIHKAKGLEFDNVIVFDAVDGRIPNYNSRHNPRQAEEDARKFYVALTRAKKRLYVSQCISRTDWQHRRHDVHLTPLMQPIIGYFKEQRFGTDGNSNADTGQA